MVELVNSDPAVLDALVTCDESWIYCYDPEAKTQSSQWKHAGSPRPKEARQSQSTHKLLMIPFLTALTWSTCTWFPLDWQSTDSQQGILCWGFKGFQEEIPSEEASTPQIGSVAFPPGQCTSPQLYPCHRQELSWCPSWASRSFLSLPIAQTLLAVTFGYSLSLQAVVMRSCWNGKTSALQLEEITLKGTRVSCVYYQ